MPRLQRRREIARGGGDPGAGMSGFQSSRYWYQSLPHIPAIPFSVSPALGGGLAVMSAATRDRTEARNLLTQINAVGRVPKTLAHGPTAFHHRATAAATIVCGADIVRTSSAWLTTASSAASRQGQAAGVSADAMASRRVLKSGHCTSGQCASGQLSLTWFLSLDGRAGRPTTTRYRPEPAAHGPGPFLPTGATCFPTFLAGSNGKGHRR